MKGYVYEVSDEQLLAYRNLDIGARLRWLEDARRMTYALATPEVRANWKRLREGIHSSKETRPPTDDAACPTDERA